MKNGAFTNNIVNISASILRQGDIPFPVRESETAFRMSSASLPSKMRATFSDETAHVIIM